MIRKPKQGAEAYMMLPKDFGIPEDHRIEQSLHSMDEVIAVAYLARESRGKYPGR